MATADVGACHGHLSVCLFICIISQNLLQPGSQNLTYKRFMTSLGNTFTLGSISRGHDSQKHCRHGSLHSCEWWLLL